MSDTYRVLGYVPAMKVSKKEVLIDDLLIEEDVEDLLSPEILNRFTQDTGYQF